MPGFDQSVVERLAAGVDRSGGPEACWPWLRSVNHHGYGQIMVEGRMWLAHRLSWTIVNGEIPAGMQVCHTCDIRRCCNPRHLFTGTAAENSADMVTKGRSPGRRLTADAVREIRAQLAAGMTQRAIARYHGVDQALIHQIKAGRAWAHVAA